MTQDLSLRTDEGLRAACQAIEAAEVAPDWTRAIADTIERVRASDSNTRRTRAFQNWLWADNRIANVGQGGIPVDAAVDDEAFRVWLADRSLDSCPSTLPERVAFLSGFYTELTQRLEPFVRKTPRLKIFRVLAALYPEAMTTVASSAALEALARDMDAPKALDGAGRHAWVRARLDEVLGPAPGDPLSQARRLKLAWHLHRRRTRDDGIAEAADRLDPLPALRRRRGLTAVSGLFPSLMATLEFIGEGKTREELLDFLQESSPQSKRSSLGVTINSLQSEFNVIRSDGGQYVPTDRGEAVLESQDPNDLVDWILTKVVGVDAMLVTLRDQGMLPWGQLSAAARQVNPGWTTDFQPSSIRAWLKSLGLVAYDGGSVALTDAGRAWAERIHWQPEALPGPEPGPSPLPPIEPRPTEPVPAIALPPLEHVLGQVDETGAFSRALVAQLHAGLWTHPRRHFAILTGLSGSGKTLLARSYAMGITSGPAGGELMTLPVQPGWHDPGALLGYVNPLRSETYVRTQFLEFMIRAGAAPAAPHVLVLDEMNLSHPEQYMAPLLSAMETGDVVGLHTEDEYLDGVPARLPYPSNLVIIGTVNMDETTHGLSDKVLDRAFVLEFWDVDLATYPHWEPHDTEIRALLTDLMTALAPSRLHFGFRIVDEVRGFMRQATAGGHLTLTEALDAVVYAKVLPKIRGEDAPRLRTALMACATALRSHGLPRSEAKVIDLQAELVATGNTRFWR